jgi:oligopeptide/dipeptide ABC transporter ATP-binding protein
MLNEPVLKVSQLTTRLQIGKRVATVVDHLSFELHLGQTLCLVGESGCGKSMTAHSIMRILPHPPALPSEGEVLYKGQNLLTFSEKDMRAIRGGRIAMIFQDPTSALNPVYTVGAQLMEVAELHLNLYGDDAYERCIRALAEVGIPSPRGNFDCYPHQISGGMRQRVMIAMALICEPDILIADEPTTALDVTIQAQVLDLIRELQTRKKMAVLLITHDMGVVAEMAHDVIIMYAAQGVEWGSVKDIFDHMSHPYTMGLFKSRPNLAIPRGKLQAIKGSVPSALHYPQGCRFHPRCPYVMERCRHGPVPDFSIADFRVRSSRHQAKCWLYDGSEESANKLAKGDHETTVA